MWTLLIFICFLFSLINSILLIFASMRSAQISKRQEQYCELPLVREPQQRKQLENELPSASII